MNIFNKIILVIILLFFIVVSFLSIINEFAGFFKWSDIAGKVFNPETNINPYISTLALLFVIVVCIVLLLLEFYRKKTRIAKVYNVESGTAMITIDTIAHQVKDAVLKVDGLKNLNIEISQKSGGVIIEMSVEMSQGVSIPEKMTEIIKIARDIAVNRLNVKVVDTRLTITNLIPEEKGAPGQFHPATKSNAAPVIQYVEDQKVLQDSIKSEQGQQARQDIEQKTETKRPEEPSGQITKNKSNSGSRVEGGPASEEIDDSDDSGNSR